ncbi:hypothetical protein TUZN_0926 [Thermoproteus uzoniensis 768-20]|uniref:Uncharacterized protein n=1 Tax=Thermoproteus uzoniensis (strain 768-20) TaxID=999630 RepID=F2L5W4_THEU7|nr:hypothetical protein [Thermoproteus uzoniensis]AEA12409.1 hypothetical protein TUZN_0926 [Thermoproteus uzoniensis 768-20]
MKGQAALLEAALIAIALVLTLVLSQYLFKVQYTSGNYALRLDAQRILMNWTESGVIYAIAYGIGGSGDPQYARAALETLIPPNIGYNLTVISLTGGKIFTITRGFNPSTADGASIVILRGDGRIVVLMLST